MPKVAAEHRFTGSTVTSPTYNPDATVLGGKLIVQNAGAGWAGPLPVSVARPNEASTPIPGIFPHVVRRDETRHWVFLADNSAAAATRRVVMYEYTIPTQQWSWRGFVTLTFPPATAHTIRGFRVLRDVYTTGTVSVSGTAVTGTGTTFQTSGVATGARIGFGTTNPEAVTQWHDISTITNNTSITLGSSAGTIAGGTPYVIEEFRIVVSTTNATAANGGLFLVKGLHRDIFATGGTTIAAATTVDNQRAVYWLADAATVLNTAACGVALGDRTSDTSQFVYVIDGTASTRVFRYNIRASLTGLASGKSTAAFSLATGNQALTGTVSQANNGRYVTLNHGPGAGAPGLYFVTTSRVYRADETLITSGNTTWTSDNMVEIPPLSAQTTTVGSVMNGVEHVGSVDRLLITGTNTNGARSNYLTRYQTVGDPFDDQLFVDMRHSDQSTASPDIAPFPDSANGAWSSWAEEGVCYVVRAGTTSALNQLYAFPIGADHSFTDGDLFTPRIATSGASRLYRAYVNFQKTPGDFHISPHNEPFRLYARTAGITDNSGAWTLVPDDGDLSGFAPGTHIQFKVEFRTIGPFCIPAKIFGVAVTYEQGTDIPSHLRWSVTDSDTSSGIIGFRQTATYGSVPNLQITLRRADTDAIVMTQASTSSENGVFEHHNGSTWVAGLGPDTVGTRRRFRPTASVPGGVELYASLQVV